MSDNEAYLAMTIWVILGFILGMVAGFIRGQLSACKQFQKYGTRPYNLETQRDGTVKWKINEDPKGKP